MVIQIKRGHTTGKRRTKRDNVIMAEHDRFPGKSLVHSVTGDFDIFGYDGLLRSNNVL